jgi:hypothetical protein
MDVNATPELFNANDVPALVRYLSWQALATEFMCGIVARGIPLAPNRDQRRALMHQVRTENTHATWLVKRVAELGADVPEQNEDLLAMQNELVQICDNSWIDYLAAGQVAMRGYMAPYVRALEMLWTEDEEVGGFNRDVLTPEIAAHFKRALSDLVLELQSREGDIRTEALEEARTAENKAFEIFQTYIALSFPMLVEMGVDTEDLQSELVTQREMFWSRLSEVVGDVA